MSTLQTDMVRSATPPDNLSSRSHRMKDGGGAIACDWLIALPIAEKFVALQ